MLKCLNLKCAVPKLTIPKFVTSQQRIYLFAISLLALAACSSVDVPETPSVASAEGRHVESIALHRTEHRDGDDLVTAGLGLTGLKANPPAPVNPLAPTPAELRRLAIHSTWRGLAALNPAGGFGGLFDALPSVSGEERTAFRTLPGRRSPARVLLQIPDNFNPNTPCLVLAPASGSRGVYGAIPLVGPWALPRGCAIAYTDKGAGSDVHHFESGTGVGIDGRRIPVNSAPTGLVVDAAASPLQPGSVGIAHAHSGDHPEADWGRYVLDAGQFGLEQLEERFGAAFDASALRVIAAGLSNGGGAVIRAAEQDSADLIDAVVAVMPNISPPGQPHLYELATLAALYQPCMLADLDATMQLVMGNPLIVAAGRQRCASLVAEGLIDEATPAAARERLIEAGFDAAALELSATNIVLDLWRTVAVTYSSSYLRRGPQAMPCGFAFDASSASPGQVASWWSVFSGIAPGTGIALVDSLAANGDRAMPGLRCLHALGSSGGESGRKLRAAMAATRPDGHLPDIPVLIVHGREDGLVPAALTSRPYVKLARSNGAEIAYWEIANAQHFDALLAAPVAQGRLVPILPYGWAALDHLLGVLDGRTSLGADRLVEAQPAAAGESFGLSNRGL